MDLLDEFMPGMGDVLAAQENALTSVVATLTAQLQLLAATNERQAQKVAQLESTQLSMRLAIKELQNTPAPAPVVVEVPSEPTPPDTSVVDALATLSTRMEQLQQNVQQQVAEQMQQALVVLQSSQVVVDDAPARALLEEKFRALDEKVNVQINVLRSEATDSLAERTKQTEEAVRTQLEQLEKRFDYLSRVKMEVKEIMRRADRQEQSIEDVRTGIEMLAKSLGSDDVDSETSEGDEPPEDEQEQTTETEQDNAPQAPIRKSALHFIPVFRSEKSQEDVTADAAATPSDGPSIPAEPTDASPLQRSSSPLRSKSIATMSKYVRRSLRRLHHATEPAIPVLFPSEIAESSVPEAVIEQPNDVQTAAPPTVAVEPSPQQSEGERTTEIVVAAVAPLSTPPPEPEANVEVRTKEEKQEQVAQPEEVKETGDQEVMREELPQQYRSRMATQQKEMDEHVELFRSSSSSGNLIRPAMLTSVVRARRQRRQTSTRKESDFQINELSPQEVRGGGTTRPQSANIAPTEPRPPLTKERIRELWMFLLAKLVRLQRLRQLNGINAEKALFRKREQMSMGSRVKRLEENTSRLDESLEYLERHVQDNSSAINALDESIVELQPVVDRVQKMERTQKSQARTIVDIEEKVQELDVEIQRLRTSARRTSSMSSNVTTAVTNAISTQLQDVAAKFSNQASAFEASEKLLTQVSETDIPALHDKIELSLYTLRQEAEQRTSEAAVELQKVVDQLQNSQRISDGNVLLRITDFCNRIYHTLLGMSGAMLQSVELTRAEQSTKNPSRTSLDVGIELLHGIFTHLIANCKSLFSHDEVESEVDFLVDTAMDFQKQLEKLKGQAAIAKAATHALDTGGNTEGHDNAPTPTVPNSSFDDHLVFITTTKLKELEVALITRETQKEGNQTPELTLFMHDAVVQVRAVLFLLLLHAEASNSRHHVEGLRTSYAAVQSKVDEHGFAIGHLDSTIALVKMMNTRLDSFLELSFAYAKEEDVKNSIEELMTANSDMRDLLTTSLDATRSETLERDGLLGEEMNQLIARVSKKLDKDELLWTQEVLERQVQNVAKSSLDEHDLIDIHRRLRRKIDKNQLKSLLQGHRGRLEPGMSFARNISSIATIDEGSPKSAPLIGAKCISCHGELPPTKAMIKNVVRDEVQNELAKSRAQKLPPSSLATFNASSHRSMDSFKKELLLASLQQQKHGSK
ncbi:hypothetical protein PR001_g5123 [Phytophthora rubi]|uniref:Uncharacterized protein n=3 Tax=Phytophthora rubi TaxID=129364 RepID=A0A6A3NZC7_9STRA|nr:hypothetical protein PR001_g5123 [Phytophthora rubi]KAE9048571.1 hypothetical protein PR002_g379 [Phytophthora rubi]